VRITPEPEPDPFVDVTERVTTEGEASAAAPVTQLTLCELFTTTGAGCAKFIYERVKALDPMIPPTKAALIARAAMASGLKALRFLGSAGFTGGV
jgi:hypothetical protein